MLANIVLMAILALAPPAAGQIAASPEDVASARRQADLIIAEGEAEGLFENVTRDNLPRLRHVQSGMTCVFNPVATRNIVRIFPVSATAPRRGDDVGCNTSFDGAGVTIYATRKTPMPSVDEDMRSTIDSLMQAWPDAEALDGEFQIATAEGQEKPALVAVRYQRSSGQDVASFALISHVRDWSFKLRATGPASDAQSIARTSSLMFSQSLPRD